ncbi:hypothetical protein QQ054_18750 [Oscillatoria amoena NRMC-F 0135]|nr:hypothetical protein [Oscillatoria amoena NRMC-F 0135]
MALSILKALQETLAELYSRGTKSSLEQSIEKILRVGQVSDKQALDLIQEANAKIIQTQKGDGLLLILDEVGKFLEYAALNPERQDVFFLQQLAEMASRSGRQPLVVICLLHQGFQAYAEQLTQATQREWDKISGRFDEILFHQPLDQAASLVASALNPDLAKIKKAAPSLLQNAEATMDEAIRLGWYGTSASRETLRRLPSRLAPLDPMVLPVMTRVFQKFGQNERSLFSFLFSYEPFGLRTFSQQNLLNGKTQPYRLADFYDYMRANLGHRLGVAHYRSHWNVIESVIEAHTPEKTLEVRALKTVGVLNLLDADDLRPTQEAICWAVGGKSQKERFEVKEILSIFAARSHPILFFRGTSRGYSLWSYSSVNIQSRIEEAQKAIPKVTSIAEVITEQLDARPVVARAHYIRTGNLRYFDVVYCRPDELAEKAKEYRTQADGFILVPLCETDAENKRCKAAIQDIAPRKDLIRLVAVPRPLSYLSQSALDVLRWEWVNQNTPELNEDKMARGEVELHLREAKNRFQTQIQEYVGLNRISGQSSLEWFYYEKKEIKKDSFQRGREILELLSHLCDNEYRKAPRIKNEMVNRHNLSSAAAAARMRLIELMFVHAHKQDLGMPLDRKPPEKSMYLSVLRTSGLHTETKGKWGFSVPASADEDVCNVRPVLDKIRDILAKHPDSKISVDSLMEELRQPPYGLRHGLFPIFLALVAVEDEQEVAFYENGTFLREIGKDAFLRMTKAPDKFEIQFCKIEGVRSELFQQLAQVLELSRIDNKDVELLDVVRNLCQFVAQLPEYVRQTKRLENAKALAVRDVILQAREPVRMVFHDLPEACGFSKFEIGKPASTKKALEFVGELKQCLDELRSAFSNLQGRIESGLAEELGYKGLTVRQYRRKLAERAENLLVRVTENKLKAFAFRLFDESLSETDWLNSVGSVLALRPPDKWKDEDEDTFHRELEASAGRFKRAESAAFAQGKNGKSGQGLRVAITQADGVERQEVIHIDENEEKLLDKLQQEIASVIQKNERLGLAAASRAIWSQLKSTEEQP